MKVYASPYAHQSTGAVLRAGGITTDFQKGNDRDDLAAIHQQVLQHGGRTGYSGELWFARSDTTVRYAGTDGTVLIEGD
jgi:hypothetical protein